ncbi:MAG: MATE family efflux transporter [Eubacteriaceae bacterium]|jgi:putative MATE family efflux protein
MTERFDRKALTALIVPLFFEQLLLLLVGLADTFVVSYAGEAAVSGVSLVNSFNTIFICLSTALAAGGAVIISQYIGNHAPDKAGEASSQLLTVSLLSSVIIALVILLTCRPLLNLLFGSVAPDVMEACVTYLQISAFSYPALAVYNAGAALYRSIGRTSTTMYVSLIANAINIAGNVIGVFVLHAGVAGVAWPSLIARSFSAVVITICCFNKKHPVRYLVRDICQWNRELMRRILGIAVPNGLENGVHQLVKVALSSLVALFGTSQIAANGIAQSIWSLASLIGLAMAPAFTTVIGQCMGAEDIEAASGYFRRLLKITLLLSIGWNLFTFALTPFFMQFYAVSDEVRQLVIQLVLINNLFNAFVYPFAGPLGNGLRAAGDIRYTVTVSITLTVVARLFFSWLLGLVFNMGVIGIAWGMNIDLVIRGFLFYRRYRRGTWKSFRLI